MCPLISITGYVCPSVRPSVGIQLVKAPKNPYPKTATKLLPQDFLPRAVKTLLKQGQVSQQCIIMCGFRLCIVLSLHDFALCVVFFSAWFCPSARFCHPAWFCPSAWISSSTWVSLLHGFSLLCGFSLLRGFSLLLCGLFFCMSFPFCVSFPFYSRTLFLRIWRDWLVFSQEWVFLRSEVILTKK